MRTESSGSQRRLSPCASLLLRRGFGGEELGGFTHFANVVASVARTHQLQVNVQILNLGLIVSFFCMEVGTHQVGIRVLRFAEESFAQAFLRLVEVVLAQQRNSQKEMALRRIGVGFQAATDQTLGLSRLALVAQEQSVSKLRGSIVTSAEIDRFLKSFNRLVIMI